MNHNFAPGLQSKTQFYPIAIPVGQTRLVIQRHNASSDHFDMRLHEGDSAHSWVIRSLPGKKKFTLAIQQPTHESSYSDFEGKIAKGYGAGTVKKVMDVEANILEASDKRIKMELPSGNFLMIKPKKWNDPNKWLMIKTSAILNPITSKPKYKVIDEPDYTNDQIVLQPKYDGSNSIIHLKSNDYNDIYSYRNRKSTGLPIEHSDQVPTLKNLIVPKSLNDTILRGELYATKNNKPLPAEQISGILNASLAKSLQRQKELAPLKAAIFDIIKYHGKNVEQSSYSNKYEMLKAIEAKLPKLRVPETAFTEKTKRRLVESIKAGKHPDTKEGVVSWSLNKPTGDPAKLKFRDNVDVYIREIYPAIKQSTGEAKNEAGGIRYSLTPRGPIVGNVGTGYSRAQRIDLLDNPMNYIGNVARIKSQQQFRSGAFRTPVFVTMDIEKNLQ